MKFLLKMLSLSAVFFYSVNSYAIDGYKDFKFGMSVEELKNICKSLVYYKGTEPPNITCRDGLKEEDISIGLNVGDNGLDMVRIEYFYNQKLMEEIHQALSNKYKLVKDFDSIDYDMFNNGEVDTIKSYFANKKVMLSITRIRTTNENLIQIHYFSKPVEEPKKITTNDV